MKTITKLILLLAVILPVSVKAQNMSDYIIVNGVVKEKQSNKKLAYVNVYYPDQNIGSITNADGEFTLRIAKPAIGHLEFSCLGYNNLHVSLQGHNVKDTLITLLPTVIVLNPITIYSGDPVTIVKEAIAKIKNNYSRNKKWYSGFYRETIKKRNTYVNISEAVVDVYKTPYSSLSIGGDKVFIDKGRHVADYNKYDTVLVKYSGGPRLFIQLDVVKNPDFFLTEENVPFYHFDLEQSLMIDDRAHFVIRFYPRNVMLQSPFYGTLYIDQENLTFSRAEFNMSIDNKKLATDLILVKKPATMRFTPESVSYLCIYKQHNGESYLYYARNEMQFKCDWKRRLFSTRYTIVSEAVITGLKTVDESPANKSAFRQRQIFSDKVIDFYDKDYWQNYNIIDPTESLELAVRKLLKK